MVKEANTGEKLAQSIKMFTEKRRKQVYDSLNELEEERFNAFRESFGRMNKVVNVSARPLIPIVHPKSPWREAQDFSGGRLGDNVGG